jgi:mannose/fructose/N-acetylgalactosamine-specific phosphotransferase system component IIC
LVSVVLNVPGGGGVTGAGATMASGAGVVVLVVVDVEVCAIAAAEISISAAVLVVKVIFRILFSSRLHQHQCRIKRALEAPAIAKRQVKTD